MTTSLRTFVVLFQATSPCDRWIWIASLALVGSCLVFALLVGGVYYRSRWFRAVIGGFEGESISVVIKKAPDLSKVVTSNVHSDNTSGVH